MSIGMTYDEFWEGDAERVVAYRKAYKLQRQNENFSAWLQGRYIYDALSAVVPALRGLSKEPILPYLEEPYPSTKEELEAYQERKIIEDVNKFREYAQAQNAARKAREEAMKNANDDRPTTD